MANVKKTLKVGDNVYIRAKVMEIFPVSGQQTVRLGIFNMDKVQPIKDVSYTVASVQGTYVPIVVIFDDGTVIEVPLPV